MKMIRLAMMLEVLLLCAPLFGQTKPCEELKNEIEAKLKDKGVKNFTLDIVPVDQVKDQKVVGSCDGGKNKITYTKESATKAPEPAKK